MKRVFPVFTVVLLIALISLSINASPLKNNDKKNFDAKEKLFAGKNNELNARFMKYLAEFKNKNDGKKYFTAEILKSKLRKESALSKAANKPVKKDDPAFRIGRGFNCDGWISEDFTNSNQTFFPLTQSLPLTFPEMADDVPFPLAGATTLNNGFSIASIIAFDVPFHVLSYSDHVFPFENPAPDYLTLDYAFDHSSNTVYALYLNYSAAGKNITKAGTGEAVNKPQGGLMDGFYLVQYKFYLDDGFSVLFPQSEFIPVNIPESSSMEDWPNLLIGLACDRSGQLYTVDYKTKKLCRINKNTGQTTIVGNLDIPFLNPEVEINNYLSNEFINLEVDAKTNQLYLLDSKYGWGGLGKAEFFNKNSSDALQNAPPPVSSKSQLYGINRSTAEATLLKHGSEFDYLWTEDPGFVENYFISALRVPQSGIALNYPYQGELLYAGEFIEIDWWGYEINYSNIEYSTDNGNSWMPIVRNHPAGPIAGAIGFSENNYTWKVPIGLPSTIIIRVSDSENSYIYDECLVNIFDLHLISPNGGEYWHVNSDQDITWYFNAQFFRNAVLNNGANTDPENTVSLYYSRDNEESWELIAAGVPTYNGLNTYRWSTPGVPSTNYKVLIFVGGIDQNKNDAIKKRKDAYWYDISDECFTLYVNSAGGNLIVTSPDGKEQFTGGTYQYITWRKTGGIVNGSLLLEYSSDGGRTWNKINNSPIAGVMRYSWLVPKINSTHCLVRICNYLTRREYDRSNAEFSISTAAEAVNFPNPFNPATKIVFGLEKNEFVSLIVYNSIGQQVAELVNKQLNAGKNEFEFNGAKLPSGVYYYNLRIGDKSEIHKMLLLK